VRRTCPGGGRAGGGRRGEGGGSEDAGLGGGEGGAEKKNAKGIRKRGRDRDKQDTGGGG